MRKVAILAVLSVALSGCFMAPMALIGPAASGFTTASLIQSGATTTASYMIKKATGKTIGQHAFDAVSNEILQQTYLPKVKQDKIKVTP